MAQYLIELDLGVNEAHAFMEIPLMVAIKNSKYTFEIVQLLVDSGADFNTADSNGNIPLTTLTNYYPN